MRDLGLTVESNGRYIDLEPTCTRGAMVKIASKAVTPDPVSLGSYTYPYPSLISVRFKASSESASGRGCPRPMLTSVLPLNVVQNAPFGQGASKLFWHTAVAELPTTVAPTSVLDSADRSRAEHTSALISFD